VAADRLTLAVIERHHATGHIGLGYVEGFGLTRGAIATSIAHDSHNLIVIGCDPADMALAANHVAEHGGGIAVAVDGTIAASLPLTVAGLMSDRPLAEVDAALEEAKAVARSLGVPKGVDPFMSLSFLSLPVIPSLRVTTRGVFDVDRWQYL
jgi:adenine deaminase